MNLQAVTQRLSVPCVYQHGPTWTLLKTRSKCPRGRFTFALRSCDSALCLAVCIPVSLRASFWCE